MFQNRSNSGIQPTRAVRPELAESGLAAAKQSSIEADERV